MRRIVLTDVISRSRRLLRTYMDFDRAPTLTSWCERCEEQAGEIVAGSPSSSAIPKILRPMTAHAAPINDRLGCSAQQRAITIGLDNGSRGCSSSAATVDRAGRLRDSPLPCAGQGRAAHVEPSDCEEEFVDPLAARH
jgi:hypothetical protein